MSGGKPWPTEVRVDRDRRTMTVRFDDGVAHALPAEMLRVMSPSAEVKGHAHGQRITVPGKQMVTIAAIEPIGHYAVRLTFDDGHDTGIFSWEYLRRLGDERELLWGRYLDELKSKGLSRQPAS